MADLQLQPSISTDLRSRVHLTLINRLQQLDLSPILVYRIESLVDSAVLAMAWQWDVLNPLLLPALTAIAPGLTFYQSWDLIENLDTLLDVDTLQFLQNAFQSPDQPISDTLYAQYRALIKLSTSLHSTMGTPQALKTALTGLGFPNAVIQEGQNTWGGTQYPPDQGWAVFRIVIDIATIPVNTDVSSLAANLTAVGNFWKPARCWLDSVQFENFLTDLLIPPVTDSVINIFSRTDILIPPPSDFITAPFFPLSDNKNIIPDYDRRYQFGADITYDDGQPHVASGVVVINGTPVETK